MSTIPRFEQVRLENTNNCGHSCFFCPREQLTRDKGFMSLEDLALALDNIHPHVDANGKEVHLHGYGEPLLDKELPEKVRMVKVLWPNAKTVIFSTLGLPLSPIYLKDLVSAGLSMIRVSIYGETREAYKKIHNVDMFGHVKINLMELQLLQRQGHKIMVGAALTGRDLLKEAGLDQEIESMTQKNLANKSLHNYGGGRNYNTPIHDPKTVCTIVSGNRANILQVTWNLDVIPCCFDFNNTVVFGSLRHDDLPAIFQSDAYRSFIDDHLTGNAGRHAICDGCDAGPFRPRTKEELAMLK